MLTIVSDNLYWRVSPSIVSTTMDENFTFYSLTWITEKVWTKEETQIVEQKYYLKSLRKKTRKRIQDKAIDEGKR